MKGVMAITLGAAGLVAASAAGEAIQTGAGADAGLRDELALLSRRRVFVGHQSVGMNVLDGVRLLASEAGARLEVVDVTEARGQGEGALLHAFLPANGRPELKLESYARVLGAGPAQDPDLALMKFCWADFDRATDARALFARYQATLAGLRRVAPRTTFVHVTVPLTTVQGGVKAFVKRLLGRTPYGVEENARRDDYNVLLRAAYAGREPLFDLAAIEATGPDGSPVTVEWGTRRVPALAAAYTDDGGHLNDAGRRRAARALIALLAAIPAPDRR